MQAMSVDQLREAFLSFFESKGHLRMPSASLTPHNDPTLLLTAAGMVPFKPYFLGAREPEVKRAVTAPSTFRSPPITGLSS